MNALAHDEQEEGSRTNTLYIRALCRWMAVTPVPSELSDAVDHAAALHTLIKQATHVLDALKADIRKEAGKSGGDPVELRGREAGALVVFPARALHGLDMLTHSELPPEAQRLYVRESSFVPVSTWRRVFDAYPAKLQTRLLKEPVWTLSTPQVSFKP